MDELIKGYTGTMGLAFVQAISSPFNSGGSPEKAYKRLSEMPAAGMLFQPNDAGGIINNVYETMQEFAKTKASVDDLIERGEKAKAMDLIQRTGNDYALGEISHSFTREMGELTKFERAVRASDMSPEEKRAKLDEIRQIKIKYAATMREAVDKTKLQ